MVSDRPDPPGEPLVYEEITSSSVTLSWKAPKDNGGSEITYVNFYNLCYLNVLSFEYYKHSVKVLLTGCFEVWTQTCLSCTVYDRLK